MTENNKIILTVKKFSGWKRIALFSLFAVGTMHCQTSHAKAASENWLDPMVRIEAIAKFPAADDPDCFAKAEAVRTACFEKCNKDYYPFDIRKLSCQNNCYRQATKAYLDCMEDKFGL